MSQGKSWSDVKKLENKAIEEFEEMTKNVEEVQRETLRKILEDNGESEYLRKFGMDGRMDVETYKQCVPIVAHKDLEKYIQRIMDGDNSPVLTGVPLTHVSRSSGTSQGKPKYVPFNGELFKNTAQIYQTSFAYRNREFPIANGKALNFIYGSKQFKTNGGILAGTATTHVFAHPLYTSTMKAMQSESCSPIEVIFGSNFHQSLYCHLLCGLLHHNDVQIISSTFAHSLVQAFETFESVWEELCTDIRTGILNERITDANIRAVWDKILKPDAKLAELIREKCIGLGDDWCGLIPEIFPNVKYVYGIMTGSMMPYVDKLRRYSGELPLICGDYGASEGWIAVNVNPRLSPESATFAVVPNIGYFEFIPVTEVSNGGFEAKPVGLSEVEVGEEYEIVITTFAGLYRYKLGDIVEVTGFHNSTPEVKFVRRESLILNINIDKNTEQDLQLAVIEATKLLLLEKVNIVDFTSCVDFSKHRGHYVIYWELNGEVNETVLQECCDCLDWTFTQDAGYLSSRKVGSIGPLELRVLGNGTFQKMVGYFVSRGAAASQFKVPRCIGAENNGLLELVNANVVKSYFSTVFG